jgi:inorganic pyrophosphatase
MRVDQIPVGKNAPDDVNVIIEVPIGGEPIKYELDKASGALVVDRFLYTAMRYPGNYGFIPHTLSGDGDPVDVLIANTRAIAPGAVMSVRPVGVLLMEDNAGMDEKIVAVPSSHISQRFDGVGKDHPLGRRGGSQEDDRGRCRAREGRPEVAGYLPQSGGGGSILTSPDRPSP